METYTAENGLELVKFGEIPIPSGSESNFKSSYNKNYDPSGKGYDFVDATWRSALEMVSPNSCEYIVIDQAFRENIIDSGIAKKLRDGVPLDSFSKASKINSFF